MLDAGPGAKAGAEVGLLVMFFRAVYFSTSRHRSFLL
jgi:hypothetical protein